jgi:nucleoside 2-deoxyribosyltransferase
MPDNLPTSDGIGSLLNKIDALIGLGAKFPPSRFQIKAEGRDRARYAALWSAVDEEFNNIRNAGFPIANPNHHADLEGFWAWCISFGGSLGDLRRKPRELYGGTITALSQLKDTLSHADAPFEAQREFRESARRTNELFVIMAFRPETLCFRKGIAEPAAEACGLTPITIDEQEPEEAISEAVLSSIRRSTVVLCDLTFERPNCYFEAGFAKGAMRRVLFSCRADHNLRAHPEAEHRVHFDVDQFKITWWDASDLSSGRVELEHRLHTIMYDLRGGNSFVAHGPSEAEFRHIHGP